MPTFNCGKYTSLFNKRVETFNNLLYLDKQTHEHVYMLDCNRNLTYDYRNFSGRSGRVNNRAFKVILQDLTTTMTLIEEEHVISSNFNRSTSTINKDCEQSDPKQLFRV